MSRTDERVSRLLELLDCQQPKLIGLPPVYLDYGCGDGSVSVEIGQALSQLTNRQWTVIGIDVQPDPQQPGLTYYQIKPGQALPLPDQSCGLISALMVLHHVPDRPWVLAEFNRVLAPGGLLFLREHHVPSDQLNLPLMLDWLHLIDQPDLTQVVNYSSRHLLGRQLGQAGFQLIGSHDYPNPNPQRIYHQLLTKVKSVIYQPHQQPVRYFQPQALLQLPVNSVEYKYLIKRVKNLPGYQPWFKPGQLYQWLVNRHQ